MMLIRVKSKDDNEFRSLHRDREPLRSDYQLKTNGYIDYRLNANYVGVAWAVYDPAASGLTIDEDGDEIVFFNREMANEVAETVDSPIDPFALFIGDEPLAL